MRRLLAAAFVLIGMTGIAAACPDYNQTGAVWTLTGDDLYAQQGFQLTAGGPNSLLNCGFQHTGYVTTAPTFTFYLSGMDQYRLEMEVDGGSCDTVLLVNTAERSWFFDDDSAGNAQPFSQMRGGQYLNGKVDVWMGTYSGEYCGATLLLETFLY